MTNGAAIGYMILAVKSILGAQGVKMDYADMQRLASSMYRTMDLYSEEEAEREYQNT